MKASILLPTLGKRDEELRRLFHSLENQTIMAFELIIVSQDNHDRVADLLRSCSFAYKHIRTDKRGLSHARNVGMRAVSGNVLLLSDDDAWYPTYAIEKVLYYKKTYEWDVSCFTIYDPDIKCFYKNYESHHKHVGKWQILKKSSIELCFNLDHIEQDEIVFDEHFGLGTSLPSGEENLLLYHLWEKGYQILFFDEMIVYHQKKYGVKLDHTFITTKSEIGKRILGRFLGYLFVNALLIKHLDDIKQMKKSAAFSEVFHCFASRD